MADRVIVERDRDDSAARSSNTGVIVGIVAVVLLVLLALFVLPGLRGNANNGTGTMTNTMTPAPTTGQ